MVKEKFIRTGICFAILVAMLGGILGIDRFDPPKRSIDIVETLELTVSGQNIIGQEARGEQGEISDVAVSGMDVAGKSAILIDADSGKIMYSKNADEKLPPASVTKVMTMLLVLEAVEKEQISLEDVITISERAASMGGSQMNMEVGEQHPLEDLMRGIAMVSANDGCVAVAEYVAGSVEIFVENMNKRAKELGMENTNFVNTNGLPAEGHYSTARDIAIMSKELLKYTKDHEWFTTWQSSIIIGRPGREKEFGLTNTNRLIKQYPGANGIKTGYTAEAGYCLSASATREDLSLIAVILGCESAKIRQAEISKMLDYGFAAYDSVKLAEKGQILGAVEVEKGMPESTEIMAEEKISVLVQKGKKDSITTTVEFLEMPSLPMEKGSKAAELVVYQDGTEIGRYPLVTAEEVKKATFGELGMRMFQNSIDFLKKPQK